MSGTVEFQNYARPAYARPIERAVVRDERLTFGARGLFIFLADLPATWTVKFADISLRGGPKRRTAIRTLVRELEKVGALEIRQRIQKSGRFGKTVWKLKNPSTWAQEAPLKRVKSESPPLSGFASADEPITGAPLADDRHVRVCKQKVLQSQGSTTTTPAEEDLARQLPAELARHAPELLAAARGDRDTVLKLAHEFADRQARADRREGPAIGNPRRWAVRVLTTWVDAGRPDLSTGALARERRQQDAEKASVGNTPKPASQYPINGESLRKGAQVLRGRGLKGPRKT